MILLGLVLLDRAAAIPAVGIRARNLYSKIYYRLNPPTENVFGPVQQGTVSADVIATLTAMAPTATQVPPTAELVEGTEEVVEVTPEPNTYYRTGKLCFGRHGAGISDNEQLRTRQPLDEHHFLGLANQSKGD